MLAVRNKFDTLHKISKRITPNDEYENFVTAQMEAAAERIPTKKVPIVDFSASHKYLIKTRKSKNILIE